MKTVALLFVGILTFGTCLGQTLDSLERSIRSQNESYERMQLEMESIESQLTRIADDYQKASELNDKVDIAKEKLQEGQLSLFDMEIDVQRKARILREYQLNFQPKASLKVGQKIPVFKTAGAVFTNVVVKELKRKVRISHDKGESLVAFEELPLEIRNNSIMAPTTSVPYEFLPASILEDRPINSLSDEHRFKIARMEREEQELKEQLYEERLARERQDASASRNAKVAAAKTHNQKISNEVKNLRRQITLLDNTILSLSRKRSSEDLRYSSARIPNRNAHTAALKEIDDQVTASRQKINLLRQKIDQLEAARLREF